jgi:hypothetical protein
LKKTFFPDLMRTADRGKQSLGLQIIQTRRPVVLHVSALITLIF